MNCLTTRLTAAALALLLCGEGLARADFFSDWSYHWSVNPGPSISNGPTGTGIVTLAVTPDGPGSGLVPNSNMVTLPAASLTTNSSAGAGVPADNFNNVPYGLTLTLKDNPSGQTGSVTFNAVLNGSLTATSSQLTSTFTNPLMQNLNLNGHNFDITIDPTQVNLPAPTGTSPALLDTFVTVSDSSGPTGGPPVQSVPEPSTFVLAGLAIALSGLAIGWKSHRRQKAVWGVA
jgi:hypothetical protein